MMDDHEMVSWHHVYCIKKPKTMEVVDELMEALSWPEDDGNLATDKLEIASLLQPAFEASSGPKRKLPASEASPNKKKVVDISNESEEYQDIYEEYKSYTSDKLKDFLRWNKQVIGGTKSEILDRCIDCKINGALPVCIDCGGNLSINKVSKMVTCSGKYDEEIRARKQCYFKCLVNKFTNRVPWRETKPTEEEIAAAEVALSGFILPEDLGDLFMGIDRFQGEGRKESVKRLVSKSRELGINLPEDAIQAFNKCLPLLLANPTLSSSELLTLVANEFGTVAKVESKASSVANSTSISENAPIVSIFTELSDLYYKEGNSNAGNTYRKAAAAIRDYSKLVTSGMAQLGGRKGSDKLDGVGKKACELIDEFLTTGSVAKIAEKKEKF
jgi:poly [ADP-ribose] polymerase